MVPVILSPGTRTSLGQEVGVYHIIDRCVSPYRMPADNLLLVIQLLDNKSIRIEDSDTRCHPREVIMRSGLVSLQKRFLIPAFLTQNPPLSRHTYICERPLCAVHQCPMPQTFPSPSLRSIHLIIPRRIMQICGVSLLLQHWKRQLWVRS